MWNYKSEEEAIIDVLRLSKGMTYKASIAGLNLGGGKAVIIGNSKKDKTEKLFRSFGRFVEGLGGRYITAEDVGTNINDMENVKIETSYVTGISKSLGGSGDPSPVTAFGVYIGIKASVKEKLNKSSLKGLRISVQGLGHVGTHLVDYLSKDGAEVYIADIDKSRVNFILNKYNCIALKPNEILSQEVDIYAPCALGATVNEKSIPEKMTKLVFKSCVVGLTTEADRLFDIRKNRLTSLKESDNIEYANIDKIKKELENSKKIFKKNNWPTIDVTRKSVEETAASIIKIYEIKNKKNV